MLMPFIETGHYVVFIMHSYGGLPGMAAATGLSAEERSGRGLKGGIVALVALAGLFAAEGKSLLDGLGGKHLPWVIEHVRPLSSMSFSIIETSVFFFGARLTSSS